MPIGIIVETFSQAVDTLYSCFLGSPSAPQAGPEGRSIQDIDDLRELCPGANVALVTRVYILNCRAISISPNCCDTGRLLLLLPGVPLPPPATSAIEFCTSVGLGC